MAHNLQQSVLTENAYIQRFNDSTCIINTISRTASVQLTPLQLAVFLKMNFSVEIPRKSIEKYYIFE